MFRKISVFLRNVLRTLPSSLAMRLIFWVLTEAPWQIDYCKKVDPILNPFFLLSYTLVFVQLPAIISTVSPKSQFLNSWLEIKNTFLFILVNSLLYMFHVTTHSLWNTYNALKNMFLWYLTSPLLFQASLGTRHFLVFSCLPQHFWHCTIWSINMPTKEFKIKLNSRFYQFTLLHFPLHASLSHMVHSLFNKVHWLDSSIGRRNYSGGAVCAYFSSCCL